MFWTQGKVQGEGVLSLKLLFLQSLEKHPEIPSDLCMNGIILSFPWHYHQEYGIIWDTSVLPIPLEKSAICHAIAKALVVFCICYNCSMQIMHFS